MKTVIKCIDGSVQIMTLVNQADEAYAIEQWKIANPEKYVSHRQMPDSAIPTDRTFRHLWTDTSPELVIDIPPEAVLLSLEKTAFILQVKTEAGTFTQQVLKGLNSEYELVEKEATAYKAAGYPETIPNSVQDEIASKAAKGITINAMVACDAILIASTNWRNAQATLRRNRLTIVSAAEVAVDGTALNDIKARWTDFMASLRTSCGV